MDSLGASERVGYKEMKDLKESEKLLEDKAVNFFGKAYPNNGWCVILCGGSWMGKSTLSKTHILIDAKKLDVDDIKTWWLKTSEIDGDYIKTLDGQAIEIPPEVGDDYTMKNPRFASFLDQVSKESVKSVKDNLFKAIANADTNSLTNIYFDITGKDITDISQITEVVIPLGYKVSLVWLVGDIDVAGDQKSKREREDDVKLAKKIHYEVTLSLGQAFRDTTFLGTVDEAWAVMQVVYDLNDREARAKHIKTVNVYRLKEVYDLYKLPDVVSDAVLKSIAKLRLEK